MNSERTNNGIGFFGVLTLIFIVLKLLGVINWSWIWVLCPFWIPIFLTVALIIVVVWHGGKND